MRYLPLILESIAFLSLWAYLNRKELVKTYRRVGGWWQGRESVRRRAEREFLKRRTA
ncbi:MAG: hypothetical protein PHY29_02905 [Syntrophales bacterium]|nr:hypothetical protein [Syntrophales bacterium]